MPFMGALQQVTNTVIYISNNNPTISLGYTILKINRVDKVASADHSTIAGGTTGLFADSFPSTIDRVIMFLSPPLNGTLPGTANILITQGSTSYSLDCAGDCMLVFDCVR